MSSVSLHFFWNSVYSQWLTRIQEGEFHVDLYTLPDSLVRMLWDFCVEKLGQ